VGENRFKEYGKVIPNYWDNKDAKDSDLWWDFSAAVDEFNHHC
jgi:hypothetical protein